MNKVAIILAGGKGIRMGKDIPKQFLLLNDLPILMYTINIFKKHDSKIKIILVLPKSHFDLWKELCQKYNFITEHSLVKGGETRFNSVKNALDTIKNVGLVAIHDGVRPLLSANLINCAFNEAEKKENAIPCCDIVDSMRQTNENKNITVDRHKYKAIQTPQTFKIELIKEAYNSASGNHFTDDASVLEAMGYSINLIEGEDFNIKITTEKDLIIAKAIINYKNL